MNNDNTYGACAYGAGTYENNCTTTATDGSIGAPDTGLFGQITGGDPLLTGGFILAGALVIAVVITSAKKLLRAK